MAIMSFKALGILLVTASPPTFEGRIREVFELRCSVCHGPGKVQPSDWTDYPTAYSKQDWIRYRVLELEDMPRGSVLPEDEKELIREWIDSGAPER